VNGDTNGYGDIFVRDMVATTPLPPSGLVVDVVSGGSVTLRWTAPGFGPSPTGFLIEGGTAPGQVLASFPTGSTAPTATFAAPAGSFHVRVRTLHAAFRSTASNDVTIHVNVPVAPSAPAHLLGLVNGSTVDLAWTNTYLGGAPASLVLDVTGSIRTSVNLGVADRFSLAAVPPGIYTVSLRAVNAAGSSLPSNAVTLVFPGPCSGPPEAPTDLHGYVLGSTMTLAWAPGAGGPAPTAYVLIVGGSWNGAVFLPGRALSGTLPSGSYSFGVAAVNACGASAPTAPWYAVVP
jgi:hypothetical protein